MRKICFSWIVLFCRASYASAVNCMLSWCVCPSVCPLRANRPRSRSSRTKRSTWLFRRSTRSTSSTSRRFYDSTWPIFDRLGRLAAILITTFCSCLLTGSWREKFCVQAPDAFPLSVPSGRPSFPFLLPPLNIFVVGSCDHKMRSMRPVAKLLWPFVELYQRHCGRENECGI